ncbi:hypothetical protein IIC44_02295 [Patescibacteria group bacterium]|nr:hypothetical protein [Patescibacteria group bacterium]
MKIQDKDAYFTSRLQPGVKSFTVDGELIEDLGIYLEKLLKTSSIVDTYVRIGVRDNFKVRLVAFEVPQAVYDKRMRKSRRELTKERCNTFKGCKITF